MPKPVLVKGEPILLDQLLAAQFGAAVGRAMVSAALDLNPGLAEAGPVIPIGTTVILPDAPASTSATKRVVSLFG